MIASGRAEAGGSAAERPARFRSCFRANPNTLQKAYAELERGRDYHERARKTAVSSARTPKRAYGRRIANLGRGYRASQREAACRGH